MRREGEEGRGDRGREKEWSDRVIKEEGRSGGAEYSWKRREGLEGRGS
jgi:hypothetical protein